MQLDSATYEGFKNWFFGRVPVQHEEPEVESECVGVVVQSIAQLPLDGQVGVEYTVQDTNDRYRFVDGGYVVVNPYVWGVDEQYRDLQTKIYPKKLLEDHSWGIPFISDEMLRVADNAPLATLYNISALLLDLQQIRRFHVEGYRTTLMDVLGRGSFKDQERNVTEWFHREHRKLYQLLVSSMRRKDQVHKPVIDALFKHNYILTWDDTRNRPLFKVEDFTVYL